MCFEQIVKIIELTFTAVGLVLVFFGWIIPYHQNLKIEAERKKANVKFQQKQWEKEQIDNQIAEFYGPVSALLQEQNMIFGHILDMLGRKRVFLDNQIYLSDLPENEQKIWVHYVDTYIIPKNKEIVEIIRRKKHLAYKSQIPDCFKSYLKYALGWELLDNQKRNGVPNYYEYFYSSKFPSEFTGYINSTLNALLKRQGELIGDGQAEQS